jgi:cytochrome c oxidase subunit 2
VIASTRQDFNGLFSLYLAIGIAVAVIVFAAVAFALIRYRARPGRVPSKRSEANALEIGAAVLIAAILAVLLTRTFSTEAKVDNSALQPTRIDITAFQWGWRFTYPGKGVTVVGNSNHLPTFAVPVDRPVSFALRSADVIHAFWVPDQRFKRAAIPGRVNRFDLTFETPGLEEGLCSEFCGLRHSDMRFWVRILPNESYERWLTAQR